MFSAGIQAEFGLDPRLSIRGVTVLRRFHSTGHYFQGVVHELVRAHRETERGTMIPGYPLGLTIPCHLEPMRRAQGELRERSFSTSLFKAGSETNGSRERADHFKIAQPRIVSIRCGLTSHGKAEALVEYDRLIVVAGDRQLQSLRPLGVSPVGNRGH